MVYPQAAPSKGNFGAAWDLKGTTEITFVKMILATLGEA